MRKRDRVGKAVYGTIMGVSALGMLAGIITTVVSDDRGQRLLGWAIISGTSIAILGVTVAIMSLGSKLGLDVDYILDPPDSSERLRQAAEDPRDRLQRRIKQVHSAFAEAAKLMDDLRRDLADQQAARDALLTEAERQQQLLEVNQEQAEKIRKILISDTETSIRAARRREWKFFILGVLASVPIGIWVNHIS